MVDGVDDEVDPKGAMITILVAADAAGGLPAAAAASAQPDTPSQQLLSMINIAQAHLERGVQRT